MASSGTMMASTLMATPLFAYAEVIMTVPLDTAVLNQFGTNGWEMCGIIPVPMPGDKVQVLFKKKLPAGVMPGVLSNG